MKHLTLASSTSVRTRFFVASQATGLGVPNLAWNTSGLAISYHLAGATSSVQVTLSAGVLGTWSSGGFVAVDNANMPGLYEFGAPNAMWSGGEPILQVNVPSGGFVPPMEFQLTGTDFGAAQGTANALLGYGTGSGQVSTNGSGAALANAVQFAGQAITASAPVTVPAAIGTSTYAGGAVASVTAAVTVGTNNDKAGYSLATSPPTAAQIATAILTDTTTGDLATAGSLGHLVTTAPGWYTTPPTVSAIQAGLATSTALASLVTTVGAAGAGLTSIPYTGPSTSTIQTGLATSTALAAVATALGNDFASLATEIGTPQQAGTAVTLPASAPSTFLANVLGWGTWSLPQTIRAIAQFLFGLRSGVPTSGTAGTVTYTGPSSVAYGTVSVDTSGDITANGLTPPA